MAHWLYPICRARYRHCSDRDGHRTGRTGTQDVVVSGRFPASPGHCVLHAILLRRSIAPISVLSSDTDPFDLPPADVTVGDMIRIPRVRTPKRSIPLQA